MVALYVVHVICHRLIIDVTVIRLPGACDMLLLECELLARDHIPLVLLHLVLVDSHLKQLIGVAHHPESSLLCGRGPHQSHLRGERSYETVRVGQRGCLAVTLVGVLDQGLLRGELVVHSEGRCHRRLVRQISVKTGFRSLRVVLGVAATWRIYLQGGMILQWGKHWDLRCLERSYLGWIIIT